MEAAVQVFSESGYLGTNLNQIIRRATVTPGAFYYHFASKDELAFAIIDEVAQRMAALRTSFLDRPESGLEDVIVMTFQMATLLMQDPSYRVAAYLEHTMARHTQTGFEAVANRVQAFVADTAQALRACDLPDGIHPEEAAKTMVSLIYGCLAMTGLIAGDAVTRLAESWRILLPGLVSADALPHFRRVLAQASEGFRQPGVARS